MSYTCTPPFGHCAVPTAPANSSSTIRNSCRRPRASVSVNGSAWCQTLIDGSRKLVMIAGWAGSVVSMITPCESAAE